MTEPRISYTWRLGYYRIPAVILYRRVQAFAAARGQPRATDVAVVLICVVPLAATYAVAATPVTRMPTLELQAWLLIFSLLQALMIWCAARTWAFVGTRAHLLDLLTSPEHGARVADWLERRLNVRTQVALSCAAAAAGVAFVVIYRDEIEETLPVGWSSYVTVALASAIGANVLYWLWVAPGLPRQLAISGPLRLRWFDPASTPGIRLISDGLGLSSVLLLIGSAGISILGFLLPRTIESGPILGLMYAFFVLVFATTARVAVAPFIWIYRIIVDFKRQTLRQLAEEIGEMGAQVTPAHSGTERSLLLYAQISAANNMPFSLAAVVQYGAVFAGSVLAFITSVLVQ